MKYRNTLRFSLLLSLPDNILSLSLLSSLSMLSVGDNARQFLRRLLPWRWTMDLLAAPLLPPHVFLHPPARDPLLLLFLPLSSSARRWSFLSLFPRRLPRPTSRGFSFSYLESERGLLDSGSTPRIQWNRKSPRHSGNAVHDYLHRNEEPTGKKKRRAFSLSLSFFFVSSSPSENIAILPPREADSRSVNYTIKYLLF